MYTKKEIIGGNVGYGHQYYKKCFGFNVNDKNNLHIEEIIKKNKI